MRTLVLIFILGFALNKAYSQADTIVVSGGISVDSLSKLFTSIGVVDSLIQLQDHSDDQNLQQPTLSGNTLNLFIEDGLGASIDLTPILNSGNFFYTDNGTLSSVRTVSQNGNDLIFDVNSSEVIFGNAAGERIEIGDNYIYQYGNDMFIRNQDTDEDIVFQVTDGTTTFYPIRIDGGTGNISFGANANNPKYQATFEGDRPNAGIVKNTDGIATIFRDMPGLNLELARQVTNDNYYPGIKWTASELNYATFDTTRLMAMIAARSSQSINGQNRGGTDIEFFNQPDGSVPNQLPNRTMTIDRTGTLYIETGGKLGVGRYPTLAEMEVSGTLYLYDPIPTFRLNDTDNTDYFDFKLNGGVTTMLSSIGSAASIIRFNPKPEDGTSAANIQFFRGTTTSGTVQVQFHRGDNSTTIDHAITSGNGDTYFNAFNLQNVGFGTTTPSDDVHISDATNATLYLTDETNTANGRLRMGDATLELFNEYNGSLSFGTNNIGRLYISNSGAANLSSYGSLTITGTETAILGVDASGNVIELNPSSFQNTDDQTVDKLNLNGVVLEISIENDGEPDHTVSLASLQDGTGTDDQDLTLVGNTLAIEDDPNTDIDLSPYLDNTDDQTVDKFNLNGTTLELSLESDGQADKTVDLSPFHQPDPVIAMQVFGRNQEIDRGINDDGRTEVAFLAPASWATVKCTSLKYRAFTGTGSVSAEIQQNGTNRGSFTISNTTATTYNFTDFAVNDGDLIEIYINSVTTAGLTGLTVSIECVEE